MPDAVRNQHGTCSVAIWGWLAGWRETPPQHAPLVPTGQGSARLAVLAPGQWAHAGRLVGVLRTTPAMAIPQGPVCVVRLLVVHRYEPGASKSGSVPCAVEFLGRRGKPVKKMRLIPAQKAFAFARKLQGTPGCTVSVC